MSHTNRWTARRVMTGALLGGALLVGGAIAARSARTPRPMPRAAAVGAPDAPERPSDAALLEGDLAFYARRAAEDPQGASDRATLAALHLQRGRATGRFADFAAAESLAARSLALRTVRNDGAVSTLAAALLARHAFAEARQVVRASEAVAAGDPAMVALLGEIELELGAYDSARVHFARVRHAAYRATIAARLARWYELTGERDSARTLLRGAVAQLDGRDDLAREQVAWFHFRLGELELRAGALDSAEASFRRGLARWPDDYRILGAMARLAVARGRWDEAIDAGERAVALQFEPTTLGTLSEAHAALGDSAQAAQWAQAMAVSALEQPGPIHRAWGLFLLDHGSRRDAREVLARARRELRTRQDVYGHDLHAWALYRTGRHAEARAAMAPALAQGTEDPQLDLHAGLIAHAVGDSVSARLHLTQALRAAPATAGGAWREGRRALDALVGAGDAS
jgi:tetratricopeptide (TPR) repeat protein